jgi:DNA-binding XRE family transcriptional regulator
MQKRSCVISGVCETCGQPASYCDSVPDASLPGMHPSECGYRLQPLCWLCAVDRRQVATSRVQDLLLAEGIGYLYRGRAEERTMTPAERILFGNRLRLVREFKGLTQSDFATRTGFLPSAINHFEQGRRMPSLENLKRLIEGLGVTADYLLFGNDSFELYQKSMEPNS